MTDGDAAPHVEVLLDDDWAVKALISDVRRGLSRPPRRLPPRWLYDQRGSELFDAITRLPVYYPTEAERSILTAHAADIVTESGADTVVELGSGTSDKTRTLLDAFAAASQLKRFVPVDVSAQTLREAATALSERYPGLEVHAVVGDFTLHLAHLPKGGRRLVAFLGGTIGNLYQEERGAFLGALADVLAPGDSLLLGFDLVKSVDRLVEAYNDRGGVTADFVTNAVRVVNRDLGADFDVEAFDYVAFWDPALERMDLRLRSSRDQHVSVPGAELEFDLWSGEEIQVEISTKFRQDTMIEELRAAGFELGSSWTDEGGDFALVLAHRS